MTTQDPLASVTRLRLFGAVALVIEHAAVGIGIEGLVQRHPFLRAYLDEIGPLGREGLSAAARDAWSRAGGHLPLRALSEAAGLDDRAISLLMATGLVEEDARFGPFFDDVQGTVSIHRPTVGLLNAWWREEVDRGEVRAALRRLLSAGLVRVVNPEAPRLTQALEANPVLWDALRGEVAEAPMAGLTHVPAEGLVPLSALLVPDGVRAEVARLPALLDRGEAQAVVVRGPRSNGRRALLGAIARARGQGVLELSGPLRPDDERLRVLGPLATLIHAMPVLSLDPAPGETATVPLLAAHRGPVGITLGKQGGAGGPGAERAIVIDLPVPDEKTRKKHWAAALGGAPCPDLDLVAASHRMTGGNIWRTAALARSYALLSERPAVEREHVRRAARAVHRQKLDALAARIDVDDLRADEGWGGLVVRGETREELGSLFARCRHREALQGAVGPALRGQLNAGVRALFFGPSGTGKTLAAKTLAARLGMDLYRVDLSSVVSKYIGETEKNLGQIFSLAEELDVMLLFDEGDALFAQRTSVQTANDRYANLETNYLLQRVESFEGIAIVTTNAAEHIDSAFQRRMDVAVEFPAPDAAERLGIWKVHLPESPALPPAFLEHLSARCTLTGGQIRNAVLHASLLALSAKRALSLHDVEAAVVREYRRMGSMAPIEVTPREAAAKRW